MSIDMESRVEWLAALARYVSKPDRPDVLAEALADARSLASEEDRLEALLGIATAFPGNERIDILREFLAQSGDGDGLTGGRLIVKIVRILPDRLAVKALELVRKALYEESRLLAIGWLLKFIPNQTIEEASHFPPHVPGRAPSMHTRSERPLFTRPHNSGSVHSILPWTLRERLLPGGRS